MALVAIGRASSPVLFFLGAILVPWTVALALADTERWFQSRREQLGWTVFDALMAAALLSLGRWWRRWDAFIMAAAPAAPFAAAAILCGGLRVRR